ncbi:hypothetical protein KAI04_02115 [Candidatus Pacearchaeota archaeon]|nr:hypothetical protein [Candidatus Pacearchaeota archaeon]
MKKIKVLFDYKITKKFHSLYNSYFEYPPQKIIYSKAKFKGISKRTYSPLRTMYKFLKTPLNKIFPGFERKVKDSLRKEKNVDLIHFANHIGKTNKPFVMDYEHVSPFIRSDFYNEKAKKEGEKLLSQKNLKFLLPIHNEALKSFKLYFKDSNLKVNQKVLYPVTFIPENERKKVEKEEIVIFGGSSNIKNDISFYIKGGYETLFAFEKLAKEFPRTKFIYLGQVPSSIKIKKYKNIIVKEVIPLKKLYELLNKSKIFLQPCYATPAMMFLIAMFFKLPIITYDSWANKEYVDSKSGLLIKPETKIMDKFNIPITSQKTIIKIKKDVQKNSLNIRNAVKYLLDNESKRKKMGEEGFKKVTKGKFSIEKRNKKMRKIYEESLK